MTEHSDGTTLTHEFRQVVLEGIGHERLALGWDQPPELLEVYASELGEVTDGLSVALTATPVLRQEAWTGRNPYQVLGEIAEQLDLREMRDVRRREHGQLLGVLFAAESGAYGNMPELLNLTFVACSGEWAHMSVGRGGADESLPLPVLFSEEMPATELLPGGSLLGVLKCLARR